MGRKIGSPRSSLPQLPRLLLLILFFINEPHLDQIMAVSSLALTALAQIEQRAFRAFVPDANDRIGPADIALCLVVYRLGLDWGWLGFLVLELVLHLFDDVRK